jgi:hypothetical protein
MPRRKKYFTARFNFIQAAYRSFIVFLFLKPRF